MTNTALRECQEKAPFSGTLERIPFHSFRKLQFPNSGFP